MNDGQHDFAVPEVFDVTGFTAEMAHVAPALLPLVNQVMLCLRLQRFETGVGLHYANKAVLKEVCCRGCVLCAREVLFTQLVCRHSHMHHSCTVCVQPSHRRTGSALSAMRHSAGRSAPISTTSSLVCLPPLSLPTSLLSDEGLQRCRREI
jgi:hypothetical protein